LIIAIMATRPAFSPGDATPQLAEDAKPETRPAESPAPDVPSAPQQRAATDIADPSSAAVIDPIDAILEETWVDASQDVSVCGEVVVKVVAAEIGYAILTRGGQSRLRTPEGDEYLTIKLELASQSTERPTEYTGWAARPAGVKLVDSTGQPCEMKSFRTAVVLGQKRQATTIEPSGSIEDVLLFQRPAEATESLVLTLPGLALGQPGSVRFQIPMSMVALRSDTAKSD
jgi:hypothetical protein